MIAPMVIWGVADSFWDWVNWGSILEGLGGANSTYYESVSWLLDPYGGGLAAEPQPGSGGPGDPENWQWPDCNPQTDTTCHAPLTAEDSATIVLALEKHIKRPFAQPDDSARVACERMYYAVQQALTTKNRRLYRGSFVSSLADSAHSGLWDPTTRTAHIEPNLLDQANGGDLLAVRDLAATVMHELAHSMWLVAHGDPVWTSPEFGPHYVVHPYNLLTPGTNTCIDWDL